MAQMRQYISLLSLKSIKVSSDFILNYLKKVVGGPPLRNIKNKHKNYDIFTMDAGCQKNQKDQRINNLMCFFANIQLPKLNKL